MVDDAPIFEGIRIALTNNDEQSVLLIAHDSGLLGAGNPVDAPDGTIAISQTGIQKKLPGNGEQWTPGADYNGGAVLTNGRVPFCLADGTEDNIELVFGNIPFCLADGTEDNIPLVYM